MNCLLPIDFYSNANIKIPSKIVVHFCSVPYDNLNTSNVSKCKYLLK